MNRQLTAFNTEFQAHSCQKPSTVFLAVARWLKQLEASDYSAPTILGVDFTYDWEDNSVILSVFHEEDAS